ncbi:Tuberous sclerosis [Hyphodiscus hymeniophilus]|uniref:Tuberous sclerosis n=1 Tax=Hyphodiscus hymeniophilus TaxID=353542 RepID=A0A9P6VIC7_9HELO|nr:Tuberous sclerosis [Hyphodiscus hymeniophilus]
MPEEPPEPPKEHLLTKFLRVAHIEVVPTLTTRESMSPSSGDVGPNPEPKSTGGLVNVFKSLTGSKLSKAPSHQSPASIPQRLNTVNTSKNAIYGGPPDYEHLLEQLRPGNTLPDRVTAAESLRHAVQDYPLSGVTSIFTEGKDLIISTNPPEARSAGFELLTACAQHSSSTDPERLAYFRVLTADANPEDFHLQLASVVELARHGRDLSGFHYDAIPLLTTWLQQNFTLTTIARKNRDRDRDRRTKRKPPLGEETNLSLLFAFVVDVIKFSFNVSSEENTADLIDVVLHICVHTSVTADLKASINVIDAIITYGEIPTSKLSESVKVLCSIHCMVDDVQPEAWRSISNLCKSHNGQTVVRILLDILCNPPADVSQEKLKVREMRGALSVLEILFAKDGQNGYPLVPFTLLMEALSRAIVVEHTKVETDILKLILSLFNDEHQGVKDNVIEEDWSAMFDVVSQCSQRTLETADGRPITNQSRKAGHLKEENEQNLATNIAQTLYSLIVRIEELLVKSPQADFIQREDCINFFVDVHPHLPESCAKLVIDHYMNYRRCYPSDLKWKDNARMLLGAFFADRSQPTHIRLHALKAVTDVFEVFEMMDEHEDPECINIFVTAILDNVGDEKDVAVLQELVTFAVSVADSADENLFSYVIDSIRGSIKSDRLQSPFGSPPGSLHGLMGASRPGSTQAHGRLAQSPSNVVTRGFVQIFMRSMHKSSAKSLRVFEELLWIAKSHDCEADARITAMRMLFRLRADWANRIFLTPYTESDGLAASLYRTQSSLAKKQAADEAAQQNRSSRNDDSVARVARSTSFGQGNPARTPLRTGSGATTRSIHKNQPLWIYPDPDALPEPASNKASSLLVSVVDLEGHNGEGVRDGNGVPITHTALNISQYLQNIVSLLDKGCDWEVYSFILVHLTSQLTNQALFKAALPQIKALRELVCEQIKNSSFHEPPVSSGLRKADVAICLFQILTMVISYHNIFQKPEEDDIVNTFLRGIGSWDRSSKCCIHAISICCHELPASTSKALVTILQKMSQIITQSHVAIHILEFLACLARLPDLYVNFRDEEYRIVFMMCFRYLQYVRDQPTKDSVNHNSAPRNALVSVDYSRENAAADLPNASDDLPQYVYALAYHVIIFWFLSLKLTDRAAQVSWITKNLVSTDINGKEKIDEQAQVTLDFMQRVAYADVDESAADPTFTKERFGEIMKKRWIVGQSIVTIEQATRGGWAQITKRQPSGTSCYIIREKFTRPPPHQSQLTTDQMRDARHSDANVVLPSHLLLQLSASIPQPTEALRPLPLPGDDAMRRSIAAFDRNFTVDGHKVGVIYIGENQTQEVEILSNIMGSYDYIDFLSGLGTLTKLQGAKFNTQGLDRTNNADGEYAFCWRDRVTEIVFHVTTQMPTDLDRDPQCIAKKAHIGNDFVNIIFNNSGLPFRFDTFPSEFNYVNIVITPESRASFVATRLRSQEHVENAFYKVQVMSKPGFPEISPAAETKTISLAALPSFIRLLALNASVFSLVWYNRAGGEHVSSWRNRLREINKLRERYGTKAVASPPGTANGVQQDSRNIRDSLSSLRRTSVANFLTNANESASHRSSVLSTAETEVGPGGSEESVVEGLDFSRWA